jgi:hypothetical protein
VISPKGKTLAFASQQTGTWHIWTTTITGANPIKLTGGACNNTSPAWSPNSGEIVFASDCGRGLGLPALRRIAYTIPKSLQPETEIPFRAPSHR